MVWFNFWYLSKKGKSIWKKNLFQKFSYEDFENEFNKESIEKKEMYCRMIEFGITPNQIFKNLTSSRFDFDELEKKNKRFQITNFELEKELFSFSILIIWI